MFKLIKIIGNGSSVPEITTVDAPSTPVNKGILYYLCEGVPSVIRNELCTKFIPIESLPQGHKKTKVHGFIVTHDMIFEVDTDGDFSSKRVGDGVTFSIDPKDNLYAVTPQDTTDANIVSMNDCLKTGKIHILINHT